MSTRDDDRSGLLMLSAVTATCHDCAEETILVPVADDEHGDAGEFCCTACDAAVWLAGPPSPGVLSRSRVA